MGMTSTPEIIRAAKRGNISQMCVLLADGQAVDCSDFVGFTAMHYAAQQNRADIVWLLAEHSASVHTRSLHGLTPLHVAAENNAASAALALLINGARVTVRENGAWQPLHCAAFNHSVETMEVLLAHNADVSATAGGRVSAASLARYKGRSAVLRLIADAPRLWTIAARRSFGYDWHRFVLVVLLAAHRAAARRDLPVLPVELWQLVFCFLRGRDFMRSRLMLCHS